MSKNLHNAKRNKNDEFYTQYKDIEAEVQHYTDQLAGKHIYLNCDDPKHSQFWQYFYDNYKRLNLKRLTATYYTEEGKAERWDLTGALEGPQIITRRPIPGNGSYNSPEALAILKEADVVITNPPFSLWRDYIDTLVTHQKDFLIIGNFGAIAYKNVFPLLKDNKVRLGHSPRTMTFILPDGTEKQVNVAWYTTLPVHNRPSLELTKTYTPAAYPKYDNYDAIEVSKVKDIPIDYTGVMGVPITYLEKHDPDLFTLLGITDRDNPHGIKTKIYTKEDHPDYSDLNRGPVLNIDGKLISKYRRLLIQRNKGDFNDSTT